MDLLIVACSPHGAKDLPAMAKEAEEIQQVVPQSRCETLTLSLALALTLTLTLALALALTLTR